MSATAPLRDCIILSLTTGFWIVVLDTLHLMAPLLSKTPQVLPGAMSPLKVLILGVPICRPKVRAVMSCRISGPASAGQGDCCDGPEGTLPPAGECGTGVVCLSGPHLPPSWKGDLPVIFLGLSTA